MAVGLGWRGGIIGFGEEVTWGTAVARTKFFCLMSDSMSVEEERIISDCINSRYRDEEEVYQGQINPSGSFGVGVRYEGLELLIKHLLGSVTTTQPGTLAYNHEFKISDTILNGLTLEKQSDSVLATGKGFLIEGAMINSMDFTIEPGGIFEVVANYLAKEETVLDALTSAVLPTTEHALFQQVVVTLNSVDITKYVSALSFTFNNNLKEDRYNLGSRNRYQPVPQDKPTVEGSLTIEYPAKTYYDLFRNNTSIPLNIKFTGSQIEIGHNYEFEIDMPKIKLNGSTPLNADAGIIYQELPFQAYATDSTTREMEINIKNTLSSI